MFGSIELSVPKVLYNLEEIRKTAMRRGYLGVALRAVEHQGRYLKMFVDRIEHLHTVEDASTTELTELLASMMGDIPGIGKSFEAVMEALNDEPNSGHAPGNGEPAGSGDADSAGITPTN